MWCGCICRPNGGLVNGLAAAGYWDPLHVTRIPAHCWLGAGQRAVGRAAYVCVWLLGVPVWTLCTLGCCPWLLRQAGWLWRHDSAMLLL